MDDIFWLKGQWHGNFVETLPYDSVTPSQKTFFKIIYTKDYLYFAAHCLDTKADQIYAPLVNRDEDKGDNISLRIDNYNDLRTAFVFTVTAAGVKQDQKITNDRNWDVNWNAIWNAKTKRDSLGWYVEMEIPLTQLRFNKDSIQTWGLQVKRKLFRMEEVSQWQYRPENAPGEVFFYGQLHGIKNIQSKRQLTATPYLTGAYEHFEAQPENILKRKSSDWWYKAGVDSKIGISNDFTLDLTVNPDFGQVEADPSEVNLTAFETFYAEKRSFFIEGNSMMEMDITPGDGGISDDNLFYSRRLGRTPRYVPNSEEYDYYELPDNTPIIGAAKLTGKTRNGLSIGILECITAKEYIDIVKNDSISPLLSEPLTNYMVASVTKDFDKGTSIVQGMVTATNRNIDEQHLTYIPTAAYTGGINITRTFFKKKYFINTKV